MYILSQDELFSVSKEDGVPAHRERNAVAFLE